MEEKLDQILQNQAELSERMDKLETAISEMREENGQWFARITTEISSYQDQQDRILDRVERLEDAVKSAGYGQYLHD